ncbi:AraC family transcriptional regulator [Pandoraea norimbergensis]|uniref:AraC family transcriptional regulator n=1 Tax=Pandoraea norimbergensis TaxID=93219 RepID=A0ABM5WHK8_9BURK|nr:AraC family transcriptional regulator [Pandoraea norimbergensis]ALS59741.1 AraC family transcriptional regulator [Pandoraea norimbergensis]
MTPVGKALWYIEIQIGSELTLDHIAHASEMSRFAISRLFAITTGWSVMRYVRARRLTRAAQTLANDAPDILSVALDAGYSSHEAFTRAFADFFGLTPEQLRARRHLDGLGLVEPLRMKDIKFIDLAAPRIETGKALTVAGLSSRFTFATNEGIPALWEAFNPYFRNFPDQVSDVTYGVCCNPDGEGGFEYIAGVEVSRRDRLPEGFRCVDIAPLQYAVFEHKGHISLLHQTVYTIWHQWLPSSGMDAVDAPDFERYSEDFNPVAGTGSLEIWLPVKAR